MLRFFRLILLLMFISATVVLAARLIGGLHPPLSLSAIMSGADGTSCDHFCLFGILPGVTSIQQAVLILHSHPLTRDAKWLDDNTLLLAGPTAYIVFSHTPDGLVDSITFTDNVDDTGLPVPGSLADSMTLGDILLAFGIPNVGLPGSDYFVLDYPSNGVMAALARPYDSRIRVQPATPMSQLMIAVFRHCTEKEISFGSVHPWMGFTTIQRYFNDRREIRTVRRYSGVPIPPFTNCQE